MQLVVTLQGHVKCHVMYLALLEVALAVVLMT